VNSWLLSDALGDIRDSFLQESSEPPGKKGTVFGRWAAIAACLCLAVAIGLLIIFVGKQSSSGTPEDTVLLAENPSQSKHTVPPSLEGPPSQHVGNGAAVIRFSGVQYQIVSASSMTAPQDGWIEVGTVRSASETGEIATADFQANREEYVGCRLYQDPENTEELWLEIDGHYEQFRVLEETTYSEQWIWYDGCLYRHQDVYTTLDVNTQSRNAALPQDAEKLGSLRYVPDRRFPSEDLTTNFALLDGKSVWYSASRDCLFAEISPGEDPYSNTPNQSSIWRFCPAVPEK
jgi:hypothetical protein